MIRPRGNTPGVFPVHAPSCREGIAVLSCAPQVLIPNTNAVSIAGGISDVVDFFYTTVLNEGDTTGLLSNPGSPYLDLLFLAGDSGLTPPKVKCFGAIQVGDDILRASQCSANGGYEFPTAKEREGWLIFPLFNPATGDHEIDMSAVTAEVETVDVNGSAKGFVLHSGNKYVYCGGATHIFAIISAASSDSGTLLGRFVG